VKRLTKELDTIGFAIGYALIVAGVAMLTMPGAFILAGVLLCAAMAAVAIGRSRSARRREQ
jgi:uncharacterized membrane protein (Fun14 family)